MSARGLGLEPPEIRARFEEARRRDPDGWTAGMFALQSLAEKWSGTHDEMFAFAREVSGAARDGSPLHSLVPLAHHERWLYFSAFEDDRKAQKKYFEGPAVQRELQAAWKRGPGSPAFRRGRFGPTQTALFAFGFTLGLDQARAREAFEKLGPVLTHTPWSSQGEPADVFKQARAWAVLGLTRAARDPALPARAAARPAGAARRLRRAVGPRAAGARPGLAVARPRRGPDCHASHRIHRRPRPDAGRRRGGGRPELGPGRAARRRLDARAS